MKPKGRHPKEALIDLKVRKATTPGRHADGNGLYLLIDANGAKRWILRTVIKGSRTDIGLGSAALVPLSDARDGGDPLALKRKERRTVPTFKAAAERVHADHKGAWRNEKHSQQWIATLRAYAFPAFGDRLVDAIDTAHVVEALSPIWLAKPETADRVAQRVGSVLDWCKAMGHRAAGLDRDALRKALPKHGKKRARVQHHPALPYVALPTFIEVLRASDSALAVRLALELLILTGTRTGEVLGARPNEFTGDRWTIPAERMKAGTQHVVPLSPRAQAIVDAARALGGTYLFPGPQGWRAAVKHVAADANASTQEYRCTTRLPLYLPRLGSRANEFSRGGRRGRFGAHNPGCSRSRMQAHDVLRQAARTVRPLVAIRNRHKG